MTLRCVDRPNRSFPRAFTLTKLAKILCQLTRSGQSKAIFEEEYLRVCPDAPRREGRERGAALEVALAALESNQEMLNLDAAALERFLVFFSIVAAAFRMVGRYLGAPAKLVTVGVIAAEAAAKDRLKSIAVQVAANDRAMLIVRRAAANEAEFLLRAGLR